MTSSVSFGILSNFDHLSQHWSSYKSRLTQWFIANEVTDESDKAKVKRRAILLSALSESTYKLASDLALPSNVEELDYERILKLLDDHFTPKRVGFAEKFTFYSATQRPGESHTQWAARLRGLSAHCGFKNLEEALLDRFLMGMAAGHERDKLFAQNQSELTLAKAVDMAESVRCARRAAVAGAAGSGTAAAAANRDLVFAISNKEKCSVCGYSNHKAIQCRFKNYKCKKCNMKGHLRKMCTTDSDNKVKCVEEGQWDAEDDGESCLQARQYKGNLRSDMRVNEAVWITKHINNKKYIWIEGNIKKKIGSVLYVVYVPSLNSEVTRHIDQIRKRVSVERDTTNWDPDAVPDLQPAAAETTDLVPLGAAEGSFSPPPPQSAPVGEEEMRSCETSGSATPTEQPMAVNYRRRELTPTYSYSPTTGTEDSYSTTQLDAPEPDLGSSPEQSRSLFNFKNLF
ncbi:uncharacterized protein LOC126377878 isoform X2 [Pectinophora gossypiella]|uniref:uncharacterized protein LOC126377878 isoform X2 n=1 Tax=Pectinophora gossypiella TaxID=13191 RepID=UPI00214EBD28|nr:uncharacterized protein LOC126377878 isoform X2 [Pectinophora gossypiella]